MRGLKKRAGGRRRTQSNHESGEGFSAIYQQGKNAGNNSEMAEAKTGGDSNYFNHEGLSHSFGGIAVNNKTRHHLQTKLTVNAPGDVYEQEADSVADRIMQGQDGRHSTSGINEGGPAIQRKCDDCGDDEKVQAKESPGAAPQLTGNTAGQINALRGKGEPLPAPVSNFFETRLGHDFSKVRVHATDEAGDISRSINARAFTTGRDIVFGRGEYSPGTNEGKKLLAHELVHVMQQSPAGKQDLPGIQRQEADDNETEAADSSSEKDEETSAAHEDKDTDEAAGPATTPGGHTPAPEGMAACPDAPPRTKVILEREGAASSPPLAKEKAVVPALKGGRFGDDADRAQFAKELAWCHASRDAKNAVETQYKKDSESAKSRATAEGKTDTAAAIKAAIDEIDPKKKGDIRKAKASATADAKKAAAKKIADAQAGVTRQDLVVITTGLAAEYEQKLAEDYDKTMKFAFALNRENWRKKMQSRLDKKRKSLLKEKTRKKRLKKGEKAPLEKSAEDIAIEIEQEMVKFRQEQDTWVLEEINGAKRGWAVGRREEVDFRTIPVKARGIEPFRPAYTADPDSWVDIPHHVRDEGNDTPVAPELADFITQLAANEEAPSFRASSRDGHGGGEWKGEGFSTDLMLNGPHLDSRGFYPHTDAVKFLLAIDATAKAMGARWRVLYNDFSVIKEVNEITGTSNVRFTGESKDRLNWHGPAPMVLHFHLDLEISQKVPAKTP